jgi:hypothetical protein
MVFTGENDNVSLCPHTCPPGVKLEESFQLSRSVFLHLLYPLLSLSYN